MTDLRRLQYFVAVAQQRNFTRAAEQLHVAQPALSRQVRLLEQELGVELVHRTAHEFELTEGGELLSYTQLNSLAFIGFPIAEQDFAFDGHPTELFVRAVPSRTAPVAPVLPATVNPPDPSVVAVNFPSDVLKAAVAAKDAYNGLFLGLGAVALLVRMELGSPTNVMLIGVLERRSEIGLRRALGASRRHVAEQFLGEAVLSSVMGGLGETLIGAIATVIVALGQHEGVEIPTYVYHGGLVAVIAIGAAAGLYPSARAARLPPTEALRTV